jgi:hypothetical protein
MVDVDGFVRVDVAELSDVPEGSDHQMAGRVGELVEHDERALAAVNHEALLIGSFEREAEDAALLIVGTADVLEPPGSPERSGHVAASIKTCSYRVGS